MNFTRKEILCILVGALVLSVADGWIRLLSCSSASSETILAMLLATIASYFMIRHIRDNEW